MESEDLPVGDNDVSNEEVFDELGDDVVSV